MIHSYPYVENDYHLRVDRMRRFVLIILILIATTASGLAADPQVLISIKDHQFVPSDVPIPAGVKVELIIKNEQTVNAEFESTSLHREKIVTAGGQISVFVGPLDPGSYEFFDDFHNDTRGHLIAK
jgi:cupredoxin-like protein